MENQKALSMLDKIRENPELRDDMLILLERMVETLEPPDPELCVAVHPDPEIRKQAEAKEHLMFDTRLTTVAQLFLALSVTDNATRLAHWCDQDKEKDVKGLEQYPIYWLTLSQCPDPEGDVHLSIWVAGPDMNQEEKAIRLWAEEHFGSEYQVKNLQQIRRGKFTA